MSRARRGRRGKKKVGVEEGEEEEEENGNAPFWGIEPPPFSSSSGPSPLPLLEPLSAVLLHSDCLFERIFAARARMATRGAAETASATPSIRPTLFLSSSRKKREKEVCREKKKPENHFFASFSLPLSLNLSLPRFRAAGKRGRERPFQRYGATPTPFVLLLVSLFFLLAHDPVPPAREGPRRARRERRPCARRNSEILRTRMGLFGHRRLQQGRAGGFSVAVRALQAAVLRGVARGRREGTRSGCENKIGDRTELQRRG